VTQLRLATLAYPVTAPRSFDEFAAKFTKLVAEAASAGAELLVMPEYASMELAAAYTGAGDVAAELQAVTAQRETLLRLFIDTAVRHKIWLLPGTIPWAEPGGVRNRAPFICPFGKMAFQDKRVMTRFEAEQWRISPGAPPGVLTTTWGNVGIAICYDSEFPTLVRAQTKAGAKLILVPSCTDTMHGFNRVQFSARARALENQCFVAMAPTVGLAPGLATLDENHGYAAVFGPVDRGFPEDGVIARGKLDQPGWVYADIDLAAIDTVRCDGAVRNFLNWPDDPPPANPSEAR
jgi:predicted amidohydrolase